MSVIIDKRHTHKNPAVANRKKFLDRCKENLRGVVDEAIKSGSIKDAAKDRNVRVSNKTLKEPRFINDDSTGNPTYIGRGNKEYQRGDKEFLRNNGQGGSGASDDAGEFSFVLSKREFLDILFEEMELPDYVKESLTNDKKFKYERAGTSPEGPITKLNLLKTMFVAMGRKFASRKICEAKGRKPPFITEEDLRFNIYEKRPFPVKTAVMFAIMDASGSMGEFERTLAKRFFLLLYLFLERHYEFIEIRWILHDIEAVEVTETEFFSIDGGGGTIVSSAMKLVNKIITEEYNPNEVNIYIAQVSDGDDFQADGTMLCKYIEDNLLDKVQYFAYLQVMHPEIDSYTSLAMLLRGVYRSYKTYLVPKHKRVNIGAARALQEVFPVLRNLFKKGGN